MVETVMFGGLIGSPLSRLSRMRRLRGRRELPCGIRRRALWSLRGRRRRAGWRLSWRRAWLLRGLLLRRLGLLEMLYTRGDL